MNIDFHRIQDQFHASKSETSPLIRTAGPFTCYLHPADDGHSENYAIPHTADPELVPGSIQTLIETFRAHNRRPRLEYIAACAPQLEPALTAAGFQVETRSVLMACTAESTQQPVAVPGLDLSALGPDGSLEDYRQFKTVEKRSFWKADAPEGTLEEARESRRRFGKMIKVIAKLGGMVVGVGSVTFPHEGTAEAAGIATLPDFRRRGIAGAVTAALCVAAFEQGIRLIFLTAADEAAGRVYARAGFRMSGTKQVNISIPV